MDVMKVKFGKYEAYKDSGAKWIGEIPVHWKTVKFKLLAKSQKGRLPKNIVSTNDNCLFPYMSMEYLRGGQANQWVKDKNMLVVEANEILLLWDGSNSGEFIKSRKGIISSTVAHITTKGINSSYAWYYFKKLEVKLRENTIGMGIPHVNGSELNNSLISVPPLPEQTAIAAFLDEKTAKIDQAIAQKEQLIALLKERKQILIQELVTGKKVWSEKQQKWIDSRTSSEVEMVDSGVEWIGEIPKGWEVNTLNYVINAIGDVDHYMPPTTETGIPYLMTGDLNEIASEIDFNNCKKVSLRAYTNLIKKIKTSNGDVILARYATIGTATFVNIDLDFLVSYSCVTIKPKHSKLLGFYLFYYIKSFAFEIEIKNRINTNTQGNVGISDLKKMKIALPSVADQQLILEKLQEENDKISRSITLQQTQISKLKEYKSVLIDSAVTGKIKVC